MFIARRLSWDLSRVQSNLGVAKATGKGYGRRGLGGGGGLDRAWSLG